MSFVSGERGHGRLGLWIAVWYASVFVVSTIAITAVTYGLLSASLRQRDHDIVTATLREYAARYQAGGLAALARAVELEERSGRHERLYVRAIGPSSDALFLSLPPEWGPFNMAGLAPEAGAGGWAAAPAADGRSQLEVTALRLFDGTWLEVGKSTEVRDELLRRFRLVAITASFVALVVGLAGGWVLTRWTLQPLRDLVGVVNGIIRTGRTDARVPAADTGDAIDELGSVVNTMLDRIGTLIAGMRDSLDNVAHDLRTPLARLRGRAERAIASGDPAVQREALADCLEESDRILAILNTLMDISEAETGTLRLQREPVVLSGLLREVVELYEEVADEKGITLVVNADATDVTVDADRSRLRQVFANLVDNAVKYSARGSRVELAIDSKAPPPTSAAGATSGGFVTVTVTDHGMGIAAADLPRIWDRLYRADPSRSERGLGLGLSLVKAYVLAHGGRVDVQSQPGAGSSFTVVLPKIAPM